ncbi:MAG: hypothetical protein K2Q01_06140, partial [Rickettsiales bacterium]|nr:hypothetical protein [Rickettsiales bacterium]
GHSRRHDRDQWSLMVGAAVFALPALLLLSTLDVATVPPLTFVLAVIAYGVASTVEFEVGSAAAVPTLNTCEVGATPTDTTNTYNRSLVTGGSDTSCSVRFRFN